MKNSNNLKLFICKNLLTIWAFIKPNRKVCVTENFKKTHSGFGELTM